jgi:hypothetical protein
MADQTKSNAEIFREIMEKWADARERWIDEHGTEAGFGAWFSEQVGLPVLVGWGITSGKRYRYRGGIFAVDRAGIVQWTTGGLANITLREAAERGDLGFDFVGFGGEATVVRYLEPKFGQAARAIGNTATPDSGNRGA